MHVNRFSQKLLRLLFIVNSLRKKVQKFKQYVNRVQKILFDVMGYIFSKHKRRSNKIIKIYILRSQIFLMCHVFTF